MSIEVANATVGLVLLVAATTVAWYLKRRMEDASGIEVVGWAMTLMLAYILQLVGIVVLLVGILK